MKPLFLILFISFTLVSCDLFTTREGETPDQGRLNFQTAVQPGLVIENLKNSLKDKNISNYMACFVDTLFANKNFMFISSSEAALIYPIFLQGWGLSEEKSYITNVFNTLPPDLPVTLTLNDTIVSYLSGDSLIYSASYFLNVPFASDELFPTNYSGNLEFSMMRDDRAVWVIYFWKDNKSQALLGWSDLKGSFY